VKTSKVVSNPIRLWLTKLLTGFRILTHFSPDLIRDPDYDKQMSMSLQKRLILASGIILLDLVIFFLPLTAFFLAYVIIYNPPWVKEFLEGLDKQVPKVR
jgi:hypothetical protein